MLNNAIRGFVLVVSVFLAGSALAADVPTLQQVYDAAKAGRLSDAQSMMQQVLKEHPKSAKAHFVNAEILAKMGRMSDAREELNTAEGLQPGLTDIKPQAVQELKALLGEGRPVMSPTSATQGSQGSFPWALLILGIAAIVVIAFIMRLFARPSTAPAAYAGNYPGNYPGGYQPGMPNGYGPAPAAPGMGSGILSGLATGAAVGAGIVAGEALAHRLIDGNQGDATQQPMSGASYPQAPNTQSYDMGGNDFGVDNASSWDDSSIVADNSGGDDWT